MTKTTDICTSVDIRKSIPLIVRDDEPYTPLNFAEIDRRAKSWADLIEKNFELLADILLEYESYEVVQDEIARTLDLLRNLKENSAYFRLRVNEIASFLPRNQPLYAFACFVVIPSFMAHEVHFRIPHSMHHFFSRMLSLLNARRQFPNIIVSNLTRLEFLRERSALRVDPETKEGVPVTDAVIFTGKSTHADQLRLVFDARTLFITNGAGHNPVVVSADANVSKAVDAVLALQLYNQGQDCAAPNAILVHTNVFDAFRAMLCERLSSVSIGEYRDRSCRVGPISDPEDLVRIQDFLIHNREWLDLSTPGIIRAHDAIVEPTIVCKPLREGGNFAEVFAPVIFLQEYQQDSELSLYFESRNYAQNAMYITLYGTSVYVQSLVDKQFGDVVLHDKASILHNTHLHVHGVERGTQPYGGHGRGASSLSINGKLLSKPTLPQRDIYEWVAKPLLRRKSLDAYRENLKRFTKIEHKNVEKLLRLMPKETHKQDEVQQTNATYIDTRAVPKIRGQRYVKIDEKNTYNLLERPNVEYIARLKQTDLELVRAVRELLLRRSTLSPDEFNTLLYALPVKPDVDAEANKIRQREFFGHVYQLLMGRQSGPRLSQFLLDVDVGKAQELLDV